MDDMMAERLSRASTKFGALMIYPQKDFNYNFLREFSQHKAVSQITLVSFSMESDLFMAKWPKDRLGIVRCPEDVQSRCNP